MTKQAKRVLITGGNRGIGLEACRQLAAQGAEVILTARDANKGKQAAAELGVQFEQLDVGSTDSIKALSERLKKDGRGLDVLVNNAGVIEGAGYGEKLAEVEHSVLEWMLRVNSLGPLYVTKALYKLMPPGGVVVMVSSGSGAFCEGFHQSGWYGATKTFLNAITRRLAHELEPAKIQVNSMCPGWVRTDMGGANAERSVEKGAETIVWLANGGTRETGKFFRDKAVISW